MGALDEDHYNVKLENGVNLGGCVELDFVEEIETVATEDAVKVLLQGLGEDINREGLLKTPIRVAKAFREGTKDGYSIIRRVTISKSVKRRKRQIAELGFGRSGDGDFGYKQKVKDIIDGSLFPEAGVESKIGHGGGAGGLVIVRDLDLFSYCESCLLPFQIKCHIGYVASGQRVLGLSKLSRVAEVFAKRLQDPQRLASDICGALQHGIQPTGVAVVLQCSHIHFPNYESALSDPNHQGWEKISVKSGSGVFDCEKAGIWTDFIGLLRFRGINDDDTRTASSNDKYWCPYQTFSKKLGSDSAMLDAAASILCSLGENPLREELIKTPSCYLKWLMNFKNSDFDMKLNGFVQSKRDTLTSDVDLSCNEKQSLCSELNLSLWSLCEHHLLPFHGMVHIGYYGSNGAKPIGKSILQSIVHFYGFKLQVQERLTRQIAEMVSLFLSEDVMVVVEASHTCMISRGIEKFGSNTVTIAVLGRFSTDPTARENFLQIIPNFTSC